MHIPSLPQDHHDPVALVSVIMPTHNRPKELAIAIQSVLEQSHEHLELIVVNDGGQDVSSIISGLNSSCRIQYIHLAEGRGAAAARNVALRVARGTFIAYLDDDDWYDEHHLRTLVRQLEASGADVAYTDSRRVVEVRQDQEPGRPYRAQGVQEPYLSVPFSRDAFLVNNYIPILCVMHRRSCVEKVGGFDETLPVLEDWELWTRMSRDFDFLHIPEVTCSVRWRTDGTTTTTRRRREHWFAARRIQERYADEVGGRADLTAARTQLLSSLQSGTSTHAPEVSVIVDLRGNEGNVGKTLQTMERATRGYAVQWVVVMADTDHKTQDAVSEFEGEVVALLLPGTMSRTAVMHHAAERATGAMLLMVPPGVATRGGFLRPLMRACEPGVAMVAGKLLDADAKVLRTTGTFDAASGRFEPADVGRAAWSPEVADDRGANAFGDQVLLVPAQVYRAGTWPSADVPWETAVAMFSSGLQGEKRFVASSVAYRLPATSNATESDEASAVMVQQTGSSSQADIDTVALREQATEALQAGEYSRAEALLLDLEAAEPDDGQAWLLWGVLHMQRNEFDRAAERFSGVAQGRGDKVKGVTGVAMALGAQGRHDQAWDRLNDLGGEHADEPSVLHALFRAGVPLERFDDLQQRLHPYIERHPDDHDLRFALATVEYRIGALDRAAAHSKWLQQRVPTFDGLEELEQQIALQKMRVDLSPGGATQ